MRRRAVLNERERRELQEIEQTILGADPRLHALFSGHRPRPRRTAARSLAGALVVLLCAVAVGLVLLGLVVHALVVLAIAAWPSTILWRRRGARG
jgi:hypothetical protein